MTSKDGNPKEVIGASKWRIFTVVPWTVIAEIGVAMLEGSLKYGRHNYRVAGATASIYVDAAIGHIMQWWEGEDLDPDTSLSHITKAIASLTIVRDAMIRGNLTDDRPPPGEIEHVRENLQAVVDALLGKYPEPVPPFIRAQPGSRTINCAPDVTDPEQQEELARWLEASRRVTHEEH